MFNKYIIWLLFFALFLFLISVFENPIWEYLITFAFAGLFIQEGKASALEFYRSHRDGYCPDKYKTSWFFSILAATCFVYGIFSPAILFLWSEMRFVGYIISFLCVLPATCVAELILRKWTKHKEPNVVFADETFG